MTTYQVVHNRSEDPICVTDDLHNAGMIVDALMRTRTRGEWDEYWVRADDGAEYAWDENYRTVFLDA